MRYDAGRIARTLAVAAVGVAVSVSCPNPITRELLLVVDDDIAPDLTISAPSANSYYHGTMHVAGTIEDSSSEPGDEKGRMRTLSFSVSDYSPLDRTINFDADGTATVEPDDPTFAWDPSTGNFSFDFPTTDLLGYKILTFVASDANGNESRRDVGLLPYPYGPNLVVTSPGDLSMYDMVVTIEGTVTDTPEVGTTDEVKVIKWEATTGSTSYSRELVLGPVTRQPDGTYQYETLTFDPDTGVFSDWYDSSELSQDLYVKLSAQNATAWSTVTHHLLFNGSGPAITLAAAAPGHNPTEYSSVVTTSITVDGIVAIGNLDFGSVRYWVKQNSGSPKTGSLAPDPATGAFSFTFNPQGTLDLDGNLTIEVTAEDNRGLESSGSYACYDDTVPPAAPTVGGPASPTNINPPTWTWNAPATAVDFLYSLDSSTGPWTATPDTSWAPGAPVSNGTHTLYVRARDAVGNRSASGSYEIDVDTDPPSSPGVTGPASPTNDNTPTWTWNRPFGTVEFRYALNNPGGPWTTINDLTWTAPMLADGTRTLYVQGRDDAWNWSPSGSAAVVVDTARPDPPTVSGPPSPTSETRPTWTWTVSGDTVQCRRSLDDPDPATWTIDNDFTYRPGSALAEGEHVLYVQGRDEAGNWSLSGFHSVIIDVP